MCLDRLARWGVAVWPCLALLVVVGGVPRQGSAAPDEPPTTVEVPDLHHARLPVAKVRLHGAGLRTGRIFQMSVRRLTEEWGIDVQIGCVAMQNPKPGRRIARGRAVSLVLAAKRDGVLPPNLPAGPLARADDTAGAEEGGAAVPRTSEGEAAGGAQAGASSPRGPDAGPPTPTAAEARGRATPEGVVVAEGSPEAPREAPTPNARVVPPLLGLDLAVAERLAQDAQMTLYVERVPGHPIGRVLRQAPEPYEARPAGGVVKVVVTAGGDFEGERPPPPSVYVNDVVVPSVLDLTGPRAVRTLQDLRLIGQVLQAKRGVAGRVVDQKPRPGDRVAVGSLVRVWVGPSTSAAGGPSRQPASPNGITQSPPPGELVPAGAPRPLAPSAGTPMPRQATLDIGFTWAPVPDAQAYVLEVEERSAGQWVSALQRRSRKTAVMVEIERLDPASSGALRWRVHALVGGKAGPASPWVELK